MGRSPSPRRREKNREREYRARKRSRDRELRDGSERSHRSRDRSRDRPGRDRSRSRDRAADKDRTVTSRPYDRERERTKSGRSSRRGGTSGASGSAGGDRPVVTEADLEGKSPDEQEMMKAMGFCGFDTTKGKKVDGNDAGEVHVILKRKYRQYMNRKGGFNRPLDFVA